MKPKLYKKSWRNNVFLVAREVDDPESTPDTDTSPQTDDQDPANTNQDDPATDQDDSAKPKDQTPKKPKKIPNPTAFAVIRFSKSKNTLPRCDRSYKTDFWVKTLFEALSQSMLSIRNS